MPSPKGLSIDEAKEKLLDEVRRGTPIKDALTIIGRHQKTYENWRANDKAYAALLDSVRDARKSAKDRGADGEAVVMDFASWRKRFLERDTYPHQQDWIDLLEGNEPSWLHPAMAYHEARKDRILINTPPFHAKSTVITQEYVVYRICTNPNIRICIISKTQTKAKKFLYSIKKMLTGHRYAALQATYAPGQDGF